MEKTPGARRPGLGGFLRYVGPGLLVTVGFIDPGNWASNIAAGSGWGYALLWMVTLSTLMLIVLQHNAARLGIVTGKGLSEAAAAHLGPWTGRLVLSTATLASIFTGVAELLGGAIAINMLTGLSVKLSSLIVVAAALALQFSNSYRKIERLIIGFVSLIGLSFVAEVSMAGVHWGEAAVGWVRPSFPDGAMPIIMSVLGAVVMPHNLFLHSSIVDSRPSGGEGGMHRRLRYAFGDTLLSMVIGWAINSAMILMAAATFFAAGIPVTDLAQAEALLRPLLGGAASVLFAAALLLAGLSSSITAGMAGGGIVAGAFGERYDIKKKRTRWGALVTMLPAELGVLLIASPFDALLLSQILLSVQLPITILAQIRLTSSKKVMGEYANTGRQKAILWAVAAVVIALNGLLLIGVLT
ncbi:MAG: Nramp family divalent metal transporter [Clostridiales bacterium]|nr:Nramp family divalent metal transporter [Clostridiales bacterium]